ncbi:hypothetical protein MBM_02137 [Drepanopeziza brunnea f. sp. 'multigermtubi' MB_m1]|uniref:Uncharacterized protein n=1 Tax=Marssonina brunnea f. sp. multigermtubi (strain MB_m1) TaxID=1072389 RepID=K1WRC9_MARBU|nr:uncharacterized protein MBM_02137 [Drepanopeziza brunnea f. sp. 'multigermtubi' MB_m1]EKD20185.1 hypothetical protein MBM_02137 [Drepanopeziza brunnea f. sp. 'multigermtubi' MB_m1]
MKGRKLQYPGEFERTARLKELLSDAQRFIITTNRAQDYPEHCDLTSKTACPPTEQTGLKQTMDWLLDRIEHTNDLAGKLMQHVLPGSQDVEKHFTRDGTILQDDLVYIMKIRLGADSRDTQRPRNPEEPGTNAKLHTRRRFLRYLGNGPNEPSVDVQRELKMEEPMSIHRPTSHPNAVQQSPPIPQASNKDLEEEITRLRS